MNNKKLIVGLVIVVLLSASGIVLSRINKSPMGDSSTSSTNADKTTNDKPGVNEVFIKDFDFGPKKLTIKKGTTITWTNKDDARHDITPDKDYGQRFITSKLLAKGESYAATFNEAGTYTYHCSPHPNMKASIEVTE